jgi:hypothetical protein
MSKKSMRTEVIPNRLEAELRGVFKPGVNPGWVGELRSDTSFVVLITLEMEARRWWAKAEPGQSPFPITLYLHPLNAAGTEVQFLFTAGMEIIENGYKVDSRIELIQQLIPLGLMAVEEELQSEVTRLAGDYYITAHN